MGLEKFRIIWSHTSKHVALVLGTVTVFTEEGSKLLRSNKAWWKGAWPRKKPGSTGALPLKGSVTLQRSFFLSEPQYPHLKMRLTRWPLTFKVQWASVSLGEAWFKNKNADLRGQTQDQNSKPTHRGLRILLLLVYCCFNSTPGDASEGGGYMLRDHAWRSLLTLAVTTGYLMWPCAQGLEAWVQPPAGSLVEKSSWVSMGISFVTYFLSGYCED